MFENWLQSSISKKAAGGQSFFVSLFHTTSQVSYTFCMDQTFSLQKNKV